jgi:adenosine deaminase
MPKVELHLHLEGAIPVEDLWKLIESHPRRDVASREELAERFRYRDFDHFIELWVWKNGYLDSLAAFTFIAEAVATDLARQSIVYAEAFFSPTDFAMHGLQPGELALAIRDGLDKAGATEVALIVDLVRETGPERAGRTLSAVLEVADEAGVIGVGIGGSENGYPPEPFAPVYARAAAHGMRLTAHAGESAGPASVWGALEALGVERIGHGIRSIEDPELLERLVEEQVPLEVCPTSNIRTGVVADWGHHPARRLIEEGAMVTINSDDPAMFDTSLAGEYRALQKHFEIDDATIRRLALNSVAASFAPRERKRELERHLVAWWDQT